MLDVTMGNERLADFREEGIHETNTPAKRIIQRL